jgi:hypothetical protein
LEAKSGINHQNDNHWHEERKRPVRAVNYQKRNNALMPTPLANDLELIIEMVLVVAPRMLVQVCAFQEAIASRSR